MIAFLELDTSIKIVIWLGWVMIILGVIKMGIYLIGEMKPNAWDKLSPGLKKLVTGKGNRLLFGLGGLITALFGGGAIILALVIRKLAATLAAILLGLQ